MTTCAASTTRRRSEAREDGKTDLQRRGFVESPGASRGRVSETESWVFVTPSREWTDVRSPRRLIFTRDSSRARASE